MNIESAAMVWAFVAVGSGLAMTTMTEDVETVQQVALAELDSCSVQGYLVSAASDIEDLLKQYASTVKA